MPIDPYTLAQAEAEAPNPKSGLQWFGESLDKPGAAMRSAIAGDWQSAGRHLIPFGDTLFGEEGLDRHYWSDELRKNYGWDDSLGTSATGFALDVLTDPFFVFGAGAFGLGKATITKTGQAAGLTRRGLPATGGEFASQFARTAAKPTAAEAALGALDVGAPMRKAFGFNPVPYGNLFGIGPTVQFNIGTEKFASKFAEGLLYNDVSSAVRSMFSALPLIGRGPRKEYNALAGKSVEEGGLNMAISQSHKVMHEAAHIAQGGVDAAANARAIIASHEGFAQKYANIVNEGIENGNVLDAAIFEAAGRDIVERLAPRGQAVAAIRGLDPDAFKGLDDQLDLIRQLRTDGGAALGPRRTEALAAAHQSQETLKYHLGKAGATKEQIERMIGVHGAEEFPQAFHDFHGPLDDIFKANEELYNLAGRPYGNSPGEHFARNFGKPGDKGFVPDDVNPFSKDRKPFLTNLQVSIKGGDGAVVRRAVATDAIETLLRDPVLSPHNFTEEVLGMAKSAPVLDKAASQALLANPDAMIGKMVRMPDGRVALVANHDSAGGLVVKVVGEEGTTVKFIDKRLSPTPIEKRVLHAADIESVFDPSHSAYDKMRKAAGHETLRTGAYNEAKALDRLGSHYELKYAPTEDELAGLPARYHQEWADSVAGDRRVKMLEFLHNQPRHVIDEGLFNKPLIQQQLEYADSLMNLVKAREYNTSMMSHVMEAVTEGKTKEGYIRLSELLDDLHGEDAGRAVASYQEKARLMATGQTGVKQVGSEMVSSGKPPLAPNERIAAVLKRAAEAAPGSEADPLKWASTVQVPKGAKAIGRMFLKMHTDPAAAAGDIAGGLQSIARAFKASAYGIFGPSQTRNWLSGLVMSWTSGMFSKGNIYAAAKWVNSDRKGGIYLAKGAKLAAGVPEGLELTKDLLSRMTMGRAGSSHIFGAETMAARTADIFGPRAEGAGLATRLLQPAMGPGWQPSALSGIDKWEPLRVVGWDRLAPKTGANKGKWWHIGNPKVQEESRLLRSASTSQAHVEFTHRLAGYKTLLEKGWTQAEALRHVEAVHYDYNAVGSLDRELALYVPFWNWIRKNLPAQIKNLAANPGGWGSAVAIRGGVAANRASGTLPAGFEESTSIATDWGGLGGGPGQKLAVNLRGVMPTEDLNLLGTSGSGAFGGAPGVNLRSVEKMAGMLSPPLLAGVQGLTGKELFSGQDLRDKPDYGTNEPNMVMALRTMLGREESLVRNIVKVGQDAKNADADAAKSSIARLLAKLTVGGIRTRQYIEQEEKVRREREIMESYLKSQPGVGSFERPYIKEPETADPALLRANQYLHSLMKQSEQMRDQRRSMGLF